MKFKTFIFCIPVLLFILSASAVAQELSKEDWQKEIDQQTTRRNELQAKLDKLNADMTSLKDQSSKLDAEIMACEDELYALLGMTREEVDAFDRELSGYEQRTDELMRMSDADLMNYGNEINTMSKRVGEMSKSKAAKISRFSNRLSALRQKIDGLLQSLGKGGMVYTVGTWARDRDCLWNIAKKPSVYGNAWNWPKIWQGNKDKIRDPDIIKPGWKLNIPPGKELTSEERSAANSYYKKKAGS